MISKKMESELNEQMNRELYSAYLYLAMSAYFHTIGLPGFAHWMRIQHEEENMHFSKMFDYILSQGGDIHLKPIEEPPQTYGTPLEVVEKTLKHEQLITDLIHKRMDLAVEKKDYATQAFLQWYVTEQVEEEASVNGILYPLRMLGEDKRGLMMIDQQLASRTLSVSPPTD